MDYLIRGLFKDRKVRFLALRNTDCINEAISIKKPTPVITAALGRVMAVGSMMGMMNKEENAKISIRIQGTGQAQLIIVDANTKGLNGELNAFLTVFFLSTSLSLPSPFVKATAK